MKYVPRIDLLLTPKLYVGFCVYFLIICNFEAMNRGLGFLKCDQRERGVLKKKVENMKIYTNRHTDSCWMLLLEDV